MINHEIFMILSFSSKNKNSGSFTPYYFEDKLADNQHCWQ